MRNILLVLVAFYPFDLSLAQRGSGDSCQRQWEECVTSCDDRACWSGCRYELEECERSVVSCDDFHFGWLVDPEPLIEEVCFYSSSRWGVMNGILADGYHLVVGADGSMRSWLSFFQFLAGDEILQSQFEAELGAHVVKEARMGATRNIPACGGIVRNGTRIRFDDPFGECRIIRSQI